mgnify:CR=1 FL=1
MADVNKNSQLSQDKQNETEKARSSTPDPFYSKANMDFLRDGAAALDAGEGVEHELIDT